jgi:hypothetical protein
LKGGKKPAVMEIREKRGTGKGMVICAKALGQEQTWTYEGTKRPK